MSKQNRENEYKRLISLKRFEDIPQNLIDEFGDPNPPKAKEETNKSKGKK